MLDQQAVVCRMSRPPRAPGELRWALPSAHFTHDLLTARLLRAEPQRSAFGGILFAWMAPLSFCAGLCSLAVSSAFEVVVPRWFLLAYGSSSVVLALLAPVLSRSWQRLQNSVQSGSDFPMGQDAMAFWAPGKEQQTAFLGSMPSHASS